MSALLALLLAAVAQPQPDFLTAPQPKPVPPFMKHMKRLTKKTKPCIDLPPRICIKRQGQFNFIVVTFEL